MRRLQSKKDMKEKRKREMIGFVMFVFSVLLLRLCVLFALFYVK